MLNNNYNLRIRLIRNIFTFTLLYFFVVISIFFLIPTSADYPNYLNYFNNIGGERFAIGFKVLIDFFKFLLIQDLQLVWFFIILMTMSIKLFIVYNIKRKNILLFLLFYTASYFLLHESIQLRACIGLTFAIISLYLYSKSYYFFGITAILVGSLFHSSVLIFLLGLFVVFFIKNGILKYGYIIAASISYYIYNFFDLTILSVFNPLVIDYVKYSKQTNFSLFSISSILAYIFVFFAIINYKNSTYFGKIILHMYLLLMLVVIAFSSAPVISIRIGDMMNLLPYFYLISFDISSKLRYLSLLGIVVIMTLHKFIAFMFVFPIFIIN